MQNPANQAVINSEAGTVPKRPLALEVLVFQKVSQPAKFEVREISQIAGLGFLVLARRVNDAEFWINQSTRLDGAAVKHGDVPRALDDYGDQQLDLWGFFLANAKDAERFQVGKVVELWSEPLA